jgi:hypothetical protein
MLMRRFGRTLKLPSTRAIKHQILTLMLQDHLRAQAIAATQIQGIAAEGAGVTVETECLRQSVPTA